MATGLCAVESQYVRIAHPKSVRRKAITRRYALTLLGAVVATGLAVLNVWLSLAIHLALYAVNARSERANDIH